MLGHGAAYAADIAQHDVALAGCRYSHGHPWLISKHVEIPAAGTVLLTDLDAIPHLAVLGFRHNVHFIAASPTTLNDTLAFWLHPRQRAELQRIRASGHALVREAFTSRDAALRMHKAAMAVLAANCSSTLGECNMHALFASGYRLRRKPMGVGGTWGAYRLDGICRVVIEGD